MIRNFLVVLHFLGYLSELFFSFKLLLLFDLHIIIVVLDEISLVHCFESFSSLTELPLSGLHDRRWQLGSLLHPLLQSFDFLVGSQPLLKLRLSGLGLLPHLHHLLLDPPLLLFLLKFFLLFDECLLPLLLVFNLFDLK